MDDDELSGNSGELAIRYPSGYSFAEINDFVHGDVDFEDLQNALLGMASHFEKTTISRTETVEMAKTETPLEKQLIAAAEDIIGTLCANGSDLRSNAFSCIYPVLKQEVEREAAQLHEDKRVLVEALDRTKSDIRYFIDRCEKGTAKSVTTNARYEATLEYLKTLEGFKKFEITGYNSEHEMVTVNAFAKNQNSARREAEKHGMFGIKTVRRVELTPTSDSALARVEGKEAK